MGNVSGRIEEHIRRHFVVSLHIGMKVVPRFDQFLDTRGRLGFLNNGGRQWRRLPLQFLLDVLLGLFI